jgi:hypothetical protein
VLRRAFAGGATVRFNLTSATGRILWPEALKAGDGRG